MFLFLLLIQPQNVLILLHSKYTLSSLKEIIFRRINFHEKIFKLLIFYFGRISFCEETYFTYFVRIKSSKFHKKDILPVAITFCMRFKKGVYETSQRLNSCEKLIPLGYFVCWVFHFPKLLCIIFSYRKLLINYEYANKFDMQLLCN